MCAVLSQSRPPTSRSRRDILQHAGEKEMVEESIIPATTSRGRTAHGSGGGLSRPLTCDRKPNRNRQIQLNRDAMLDISKLACQGNIRETPVGAATRPGQLRGADLWAGKTMGCRESADPNYRRAHTKSGSTDPAHISEPKTVESKDRAVIGDVAARRAMPQRSDVATPTRVGAVGSRRILVDCRSIRRLGRTAGRRPVKRVRAAHMPFYSPEDGVL
jgi:hypothetical protein